MDHDEEEHYYNLPSAPRTRILKLLKENNVIAYLSGHTHEPVINEYEGIKLVSGQSTSLNPKGSPLGFRLWDVYPNCTEQHLVPLED